VDRGDMRWDRAERRWDGGERHGRAEGSVRSEMVFLLQGKLEADDEQKASLCVSAAYPRRARVCSGGLVEQPRG
jgi:hypothetical protein